MAINLRNPLQTCPNPMFLDVVLSQNSGFDIKCVPVRPNHW